MVKMEKLYSEPTAQKTFSNINYFCENIILTPKNRKRSLTGSKPALIFGARWVSSYPRLLVSANLRSNEGLFR